MRCDDNGTTRKDGSETLALPVGEASETVKLNVGLLGPGPGEGAVELASPDGLVKYYPERPLAGKAGTSCNLDCYITAPTLWISGSTSGYAEIRIYAETETGRARVGRYRLNALAWTKSTDNKTATAVISVRGRPSRGWTVVGVSDSNNGGTGGTDFSPASIDLIAWGSEGGTPDTAGESPALTMTDEPAAKRASLGMGWNTTAKMWQPLTISGGALSVTLGAGGLTVAGTHTVNTNTGGGIASPTDAVNAQSFNQLWDASAGPGWVPQQAQAIQDNTAVPGQHTTFSWVFPSVVDGANVSHLQRSNTRGETRVDTNAWPSPTTAGEVFATTVTNTGATAFAAKGSPAVLLKMRGSNSSGTGAFLCVVDKTTAPINGDAVIWSVWVPTLGTAVEDFPRVLHTSNGLAFAWSSTAGAVTLIGAAPGSACIQYA